MSTSTALLRQDVAEAANTLVYWLQWFGYPVQITSTVRSRASQSELYTRWKAGQSRYPAAKPGTSKHERGIAFDIRSTEEGLEVAGYLAREYLGLRWGKSFGDPIHFEAYA